MAPIDWWSRLRLSAEIQLGSYTRAVVKSVSSCNAVSHFLLTFRYLYK